MPIYEYQCKKCGQFETMQRITDEPLKRCPTCRGKVTKLISNTSFQLKGSGWYITDYGRKGGGEGKKAATETKSDAASTSTETKATESKATKSETKTTKSEAAAA